jgi:hypothetical protein
MPTATAKAKTSFTPYPYILAPIPRALRHASPGPKPRQKHRKCEMILSAAATQHPSCRALLLGYGRARKYSKKERS